MKISTSTSVLAAVVFASILTTSASAVTNFIAPSNFGTDPLAGAAEWDFFTVTSGSQGASSALSGPNVATGSDLSTAILVPYGSPPGGLLGGGDSYYSHDGALSWTADLTLTNAVTHVRVSYALVGSPMGAPTAFPVVPSITGASVIGSGSYSDGGSNIIFYTDLELGSASTSFSTTFGDAPAPFSSFKSVNGVRVAGFSEAPAPVPEPSAWLLALAGIGAVTLRRNR